jgi:citrate lyase subunit beta/citryl-CoA lyase
MTLPIAARPRRSVLYMPGANAKALDKARSLPADALILDLEDAVAPEAKDEARAQVVAAVRAGGYGAREVVIRVNGLSTPWGGADLEAAVGAGPDAILVPKVSTAADVEAADEALSALGAPATLGLWVMIETPAAIFNLAAIAATAASTRLRAFVMGTNDLAKETRARITPDRAPFHWALSAAVTAARAHDLAAIDGVFNDIADADGFANVCAQGLDFGFDGKTLIHPSQIGPCNAVFAPSAGEVAHARAVIAAFADPENAGKGVLKVDGRMTELLHRDMALRTVAIADAIAAMGAAMGE